MSKQQLGIRMLVVLLLPLCLLILSGCGTGGRTYTLGGDNMSPTLAAGERVYVDESVPVSPGTIVVLDDPSDTHPALISRVIATGGQTVDIRDGAVWVDGEHVTEPYVSGSRTDPGTVALPLKVPSGDIWFMGDNRPVSGDSRFLGSIPESSVLGVVTAVYWPTQDARSIDAK